MSNPKLKFLDSLPKTKITAPVEVSKSLLRNSRSIIKETRAECRGTYIEYHPRLRQLVFGGSQEKKQIAMMKMYDNLDRQGIRFNK